MFFSLQGFATGDLEADAYPVRLFHQQTYTHGGKSVITVPPMLVCQSFAKNMGLYGERVGALHITVADTCIDSGRQDDQEGEQESEVVMAHLRLLARASYSSPPVFGATLAAQVLGDRYSRHHTNTQLYSLCEILCRNL